jgi:hypothetical protein
MLCLVKTYNCNGYVQFQILRKIGTCRNDGDNGDYDHDVGGLLKMVEYLFNSFDFLIQMYIVQWDQQRINVTIQFITKGRSIAQAGSRWLPTAAARVQTRV